MTKKIIRKIKFYTKEKGSGYCIEFNRFIETKKDIAQFKKELKEAYKKRECQKKKQSKEK